MNTQWSLVALTVLSLMGAGLFSAAAIGCLMGQGGEIRRPAFAVSAIFSGTAFVATALLIGNPSRVFNILERLLSGFSMAMLGALMLVAVALYAVFAKDEKSVTLKIAAIAGIVLSVVVTIGVAKIYLRPARPVLDHWSVVLYFFAFAVSVGAFGASVFSQKNYDKVKYIFLGVQVAALIVFLLNVSMVRDWAINIGALVGGQFAAYLYVFVIAIGIIVPLVCETARRKLPDMRNMFSTVGFVSVGLGCFGFAVILNSTIGTIRKLL